MTDKVIIRIPTERAELLTAQFQEHNAMQDGTVFLMCVCEDCALFRLWSVTTMVAQQRMTATVMGGITGILHGLGMVQMMSEPEEANDADCGHCVHWHEARQGFAPTAMRPLKVQCCHCGDVVEVT